MCLTTMNSSQNSRSNWFEVWSRRMWLRPLGNGWCYATDHYFENDSNNRWVFERSVFLDYNNKNNPANFLCCTFQCIINVTTGVIPLVYGILLHTQVFSRGHSSSVIPGEAPKHALNVAEVAFALMNNIALLDLQMLQVTFYLGSNRVKDLVLPSFLTCLCICSRLWVQKDCLCSCVTSQVTFSGTVVTGERTKDSDTKSSFSWVTLLSVILTTK